MKRLSHSKAWSLFQSIGGVNAAGCSLTFRPSLEEEPGDWSLVLESGHLEPVRVPVWGSLADAFDTLATITDERVYGTGCPNIDRKSPFV